MIIGLTGKNGSGKGEVARFLKERGFHYFSLSDVIRKYLRAKKKPLTRQHLIEAGNRLRVEHGPGVLAERVLSCLDVDKNYVIDSIRHPGEVKTLRRRNDFVLFRVEAPRRLRFERVRRRGREKDPKRLKEFIRLERLEAKSHVEEDQQLQKTLRMADRVIRNNGSLAHLEASLRELLVSLSKKNPRPDWDDYFMGIAKVVALRSNCIKRKVAAVIVKDRRVISTGYNGTPRGVRNCNEGGCPRCNSFGSQGSRLEECLCSHGEENAITQAAYHGANLREATLYTTFSPCLICTKMIINTGIQKVIYSHGYSMDAVSLHLLKEAKVKVERLKSVPNPL
ncbi:MAG: AAA family ATPase [Candidatus Omnitrophica bacterium]|nr:AAA family ATPase [Candidatus Omnitrophota bacterium]